MKNEGMQQGAKSYTDHDKYMINEARNRFLDSIKGHYNKVQLQKIDKAINLAVEAHEGQYRASGEPYVLHPIAVAQILTELKLDVSSIITGILHDTVEDTKISFSIIKQEFGEDIAKLVDGVTKLAKIGYQPEHVKQAENFRKLLLAISEDIRVLMVKLADRLHNMRTISFMKNPQKRMRIAHETIEIYAPLAERIGIHKFKNELQDLSFAELHPEIRKSIQNRLKFLRQEGVSLVETIINEIQKTLKEFNIEADIAGREKTSCSIWRKMERKNVAFEQLSDIIAFRILVNTVEDCYKALGVIHTKYHMIPGGFKDFISTPKSNGYQSLHTLVMGPEQRCVEIQIRTHEMHEVAELGVAAHWAYKQSTSSDGLQFRWIRELLEILDNASNAEEFLENTKLEMYYDQVFCFTPKGDLIALPRGATPVDFAFALHSNIGLSCIGARVNGRIVPLKTQLEHGDQVEIMRSKVAMPSPSWEKFVVTGKARAEIRKYIRSKQHDEYYNLGKSILQKVLQQYGREYHEKEMAPFLEKFKKATVPDLVAAVGEGVINRMDVVKELLPNEKISDDNKSSLNPLSLLKFKSRKTTQEKSQPVSINGLIPGMAIHFAGCCHPLPGDRIVGIVNSGKGITIHTADCDMLENFSSTPERWIDVAWEGVGDEKYTARIKVTVANETGSLAAITTAIAGDKANISNLKIVGRSLDFFELLIDVEVKGLNQLSNLLVSLRSLNSVHSVERYKS